MMNYNSFYIEKDTENTSHTKLKASFAKSFTKQVKDLFISKCLTGVKEKHFCYCVIGYYLRTRHCLGIPTEFELPAYVYL